MTNWYTPGRKPSTWRKLGLAALLAMGATAAQAQTLNYNLFGASNVAGTYTDLGTAGSVIATPNNDDANSAATPIGFTFNFNGTAFTDFILNTNGFLKLGTVAPAAPYFYGGPQVITSGPLNTAAETNLILPLNMDLEGTATTEYRVATTGAAGSRVTTIQWENVSDKIVSAATGKQFASISFQVRLYETSNRIELVYGASTAGPGPDVFKSAAVGIKGSGNTATTSILVTKGSVQTWDLASFVAGNYTGNAFNVRSTVLSTPGRTYRFDPSSASDAAVLAVYTLGKLPTPIANPHTMQAVVRNVGTGALTNVSVTATVTGANTFTSTKTVASLAVGASATVTFDPFSPTATGTNNVAVTLGSDDNTNNNTSTYTQEVQTTTYAVADPSQGATGGSVGFTANAGIDAGTGIFSVKYNTNAARGVTAINARLEGAPASVGRTVYAVVLDNAGAILGRTPDYVIQAGDIGTNKVFTFAVPVSIPAGTFYAGIAQAAAPAGTTPFFPLGLQTENPTRPGTFYTSALTGGALTDAVASGLGRFMIEAVTSAPPTCPPPTAVTVTNLTTTGGTVNFTGPSNGTGYTIIYGPRGFNPASAGTTVTATATGFALTGLAASTNYDLYIRANCGASDQSALVGPIQFTTACAAVLINTFPYAENFDAVAAGALPCGYSVADINADGKTWEVANTFPSSAPNSMRYSYSTTNTADDWFFTPAMFLRSNTNYQLQFKYRARTFPEKLEVKYGTAATAAGMAGTTNLLFQNAAITSGTYTTTVTGATATGNSVVPFRPAANGNFYIGFHAYSAPDQFELFVDDISISAVLGTSEALNRAVAMYPNPSTGVVKLDIRGANAKGNMKVEVTNMLGQTVFTSTLKDNFENELNLSSLSNGMYLLKVQTGNEFTTRQLSLTK